MKRLFSLFPVLAVLVPVALVWHALEPAQTHAQLFPSNPTETMELGKGRYDTVAVRPPQELLVRDFILGPTSARPACTATLVGRFHINAARQISYCNATAWVPIGGILRQSTPPTCNNTQPVRVYEDSDDNRLYRCIGTTWKRIADDSDLDGFDSSIDPDDNNATNPRASGSGNIVARPSINRTLTNAETRRTANGTVTIGLPDGVYVGDNVKVHVPGDNDFKAPNIKSGVDILGLTGTLRYETITDYTGNDVKLNYNGTLYLIRSPSLESQRDCVLYAICRKNGDYHATSFSTSNSTSAAIGTNYNHFCGGGNQGGRLLFASISSNNFPVQISSGTAITGITCRGVGG